LLAMMRTKKSAPVRRTLWLTSHLTGSAATSPNFHIKHGHATVQRCLSGATKVGH
jgi:hypothetical protein